MTQHYDPLTYPTSAAIPTGAVGWTATDLVDKIDPDDADAELNAMRLIAVRFAELDLAARARIFRWLWDRYNLSERS